MLLFADDVVLLSHTLDGLRHQFSLFSDFCKANDLVISCDKTKLLTTGCVSDARVGECLHFDQYRFECVSSFKYLGLHFNESASPVFMIRNMCLKATKAFYWLVNFVGRNRWNVP